MITIGHFVRRGAREFSDRIAVKFKDKSLTFSQINDRINCLANGLISLGVRKGDRVAVLLDNCSQWIESDFAIMKTGMVRVGLNVRLSLKEHEYLLNDSEANILLVGENYLDGILKLKPNLRYLEKIICVDDIRPEVLNYEEIILQNSAIEPEVEIEETDIFRIGYTSGTTGKPKGVMITHKAAKHTMLNLTLERLRDISKDDVMLHIGPLSHASGSYVLPHWIKGAKNVILDKFDLEKMLETIENEKITTIHMVPTIITRLLNYRELKKYDLSSLKTICYGAAPMPAEKIKEAIRVFGPIFIQGYGQMEAPMTITNMPKEDHIADGTEEEMKRLLSAGKPFIDVEVKVVDENGRELPPREIGEVIVRSDHQMLGYWKNEEATKETIKNGWVYTRDIGYMDEKGYLYLVDRKTDMIISGGFNIYPREVEEVLNKHPAVIEVAVIGVPDEEWGEAVKAFVVLKPGMKANEEELISFCKGNFSSFKKPRSIEFVEDLPKNAYGKIEKKMLKEKYWDGHRRRIH